MTNLLNDLLPDAPREKSVLIGAADARIAEILLDRTAHGLDASLAINQAASSLAAATVFRREVCDWVATELAVALGLSQGGALPAGPGPDDLQDATTTGKQQAAATRTTSRSCRRVRAASRAGGGATWSHDVARPCSPPAARWPLPSWWSSPSRPGRRPPRRPGTSITITPRRHRRLRRRARRRRRPWRR